MSEGDYQDFTLLVAAAGQGQRLGLGPKAFLRLGEKSLLRWVVEVGSRCIRRVIVAVPERHIDEARRDLEDFPAAQILAGGATRQDSYRLMLEACETPYVVIRDVARPLASADLIRRVATAAREHGVAGAFDTFDTPIGIGADARVVGCVPRSEVRVPSNPQGYATEPLRRAVQSATDHGLQTQTLWELMLREGRDVHVVEGEAGNHKITTERDWAIMRQVTFPQWLIDDNERAET